MDLIKGQFAIAETKKLEPADHQPAQPTEKLILTLSDWEMAMAGGGEAGPCWG